MGGRLLRGARVALLLLAVGCHLPKQEQPSAQVQPQPDRAAPSRTAHESVEPLVLTKLRPPEVVLVRAATPAVPPPVAAPAVPVPLPATKAADLLNATAAVPPPDDLDQQWVAVGTIRASASSRTRRLRAPVLVRDDEPPITLPPVTEPPGELAPRSAPAPASPTAATVKAEPPVSPGEFLPPIPALPDAPLPPPIKSKSVLPPPARTSDTPPVALPPPAELLPMTADPPEIVLNGKPATFEALSKLVDGNICTSCGGGSVGPNGCTSCGDPPCRSGRCEPFPAKTAAGRVVGLIYSSVCCPDPCYQPKWEPLADAAFFVDAVRPKTSTRFRWDYMAHYAYPDRGEFFFARGDGNGKGPRANAPLRSIPYVDAHEFMLVTEVGMGASGVQIAVPYRSVNSTPFGQDGAGFADMTITAKTMLLDSELALFGFQMRTYVPIGVPSKGLGTGHVALEPGLNFGLRVAPKTYFQSQVVEWIPLGGDNDYQGPHLRWAMSINHVWWQPVKDVQLVGTLETTGISFQDGLFTDPALGPQRLAKRTSAHIGAGMRLFFCDTFDVGLGYQHSMTGKYLMRDMTRFELRYRF